MRTSTALRACAFAALAAAATAWTAAAQEVEPVDPEAEELGDYGVQTGAFVMTPRLYLGALYNDNVRAEEFFPEEAWAGVVDASVGFASTWRRHALGINLSGNAVGYEEALDTENLFNYRAGANARIDLGRTSNLFGSASFGQFNEERGSANLPVDATSPTDYTRIEGEIGAAHTFTRTIIALSGQAQQLDFDDVTLAGGGVFDNDARDFDTVAIVGDVEREFRSGYSGFLRVIADERQYSDTLLNRDSTGYEGRAGLRAAITDLITGEAYVGYLSRDYDAFPTVDGFSFGADLDWTPTDAWLVTVQGLRSVEETGDASASSFTDTRVELSIMRSVLRTLSLGPTFGYQRHDFQESAREDDVSWVGFAGRYDLTRTISIDAGYRFTQRDTTLVGGSFDQNRFTVGITLRR